jgi:transcriptional regulator with XRE-family HTH domain
VDEVAFGRAFRAIRIRSRRTQHEVAMRAGVSRSVLARIEQGHGSRVTVATLERVASVLDARVFVKLLWRGDALDRLLDHRHALTVECVHRVLRAEGWEVATEVSFNEWGERGSIDVLARHAGTGLLLVAEVKTVIADVQELQVTLDRKVRIGRTIARRRGWETLGTAVLLVVVESRSNRVRVARLGATFGGTFPDRNRAVRAWLAAPDGKRPMRGLLFLNIGTEAVVMQRVRARSAPPTHGPRPRTRTTTS